MPDLIGHLITKYLREILRLGCLSSLYKSMCHSVIFSSMSKQPGRLLSEAKKSCVTFYRFYDTALLISADNPRFCPQLCHFSVQNRHSSPQSAPDERPIVNWSQMDTKSHSEECWMVSHDIQTSHCNSYEFIYLYADKSGFMLPDTIRNIIAVGAGSFIGGIARYLVSLAMKGISKGFPWATLLVNPIRLSDNRLALGILKQKCLWEHLVGIIPDSGALRRLHYFLHILKRSLNHASDRTDMWICQLYSIEYSCWNRIGCTWILYRTLILTNDKNRKRETYSIVDDQTLLSQEGR